MINELSKLAQTMEKAGVQAQSWHRKYKPIPNIKANAPCVRIVIHEGKVTELSSVDERVGAGLRKFGTKQGSYPCMNLAPLYRVTDDDTMKKLTSLRPEELNSEKINEIMTWCQSNNWVGKFRGKYKISLENTTSELESLIPEFRPIHTLISESQYFLDSSILHQELENEIFRMLHNRENTALALSILFYQDKSNKDGDDDYGSISVAFETPKLIEIGMPAISSKFTFALNEALLSADLSEQNNLNAYIVDAFGIPFEPVEEPMPDVKLAGGIEVTLRTMFKEQRCQTRYNRIENASYPISPQTRKRFTAALGWLGGAERKNVTWINTDKNEILFAYPATLPDVEISYTRMFKRPEKKDAAFEEQAKQFIAEISQSKKAGTDSRSDLIQIFILRKYDKARTKVVYTRQTDPHELEKCSEAWTAGIMNLPAFAFGQPSVPFPMDVADILNRFWKQNGGLSTDKFRPVPKYHGMELLMDGDAPVTTDLHYLSEKSLTIGSILGYKLAVGDLNHPIWDKIKDVLALMGLLLYRECIRKDTYMESLPYLYGQLLKVSDELHALYCHAVRNGDFPTQLAGGGLYQAAVEAPIRTLNLLGQRMNPYIIWAKTYRTKKVSEKGKESWRAAWLLSLYESIADKLFFAWRAETRLNDEEKALLFIGYLSAFPKKEQSTNKSEDTDIYEEVTENE